LFGHFKNVVVMTEKTLDPGLCHIYNADFVTQTCFYL